MSDGEKKMLKFAVPADCSRIVLYRGLSGAFVGCFQTYNEKPLGHINIVPDKVFEWMKMFREKHPSINILLLSD